ncbi:hypothetical protein SH661x_000366 [Planctomicrobium sp. SH661]|uniref:hypothetical protein n=1 Tax=Planctomicrobium sp. SH661 TaxID=3448124 RepID=UPI003F5BA468
MTRYAVPRKFTPSRSSVETDQVRRLKLTTMVCVGMFVLGMGTPAKSQGIIEIVDNAFEMQPGFAIQQIVSSVQNEEGARKKAEGLLTLELNSVEQTCGLTESQKARLNLAGQGDLHRFFNDVKTATAPYANKTRITQQEWQKVNDVTQPLRKRFSNGLHGQGSLFNKSLVMILTPEQLAIVQKDEQERSRRQFRASIKGTIQMIDAQLPLTHEQRGKLEELILKYGEVPRGASEGHLQLWATLYGLSQVPEADLKEIFSAGELKIILRLQQQGRGMRQQ